MSGLPSWVGIIGEWNRVTTKHELNILATPKSVEHIMRLARKSSNGHPKAPQALEEYEEYIINELALAAVNCNLDVSLYSPQAPVLPFTPWFTRYLDKLNYEDAKMRCAEVTSKINTRINALREQGKVTLEEAAEKGKKNE